MYDSDYDGNLSGAERTVSALLGAALSVFVLRRGSPVLRSAAAAAGAALLARAFAGHCAVKAAITRESSLGEGLRQQWQRMSGMGPRASGSAGAPFEAQQSVEERADPESLQEGLGATESAASGSAIARH